jgi:hypothetical protein
MTSSTFSGLATLLVMLSALVAPVSAFFGPRVHLDFGWGFGWDGTQDVAVIFFLVVVAAVVVFWMPFADWGSYGDMSRATALQIREAMRAKYSFILALPMLVIAVVRFLLQIYGIVALIGFALSNYIIDNAVAGSHAPDLLATPHHSFYMWIVFLIVGGARLDMLVQSFYYRQSSLLAAAITSLIEWAVWVVLLVISILETVDNRNETPRIVIDWDVVVIILAALYVIWTTFETVRLFLTWWNNGSSGLYNVGTENESLLESMKSR